MGTGTNSSRRSENETWNPVSNSAVKDLLDHLARELAEEYVRLMKQAAEVRESVRESGQEE